MLPVCVSVTVVGLLVLDSVGPLVCSVECRVEGSLTVDKDVILSDDVKFGLADTLIIVEGVTVVEAVSDELFVLMGDTLVLVVALTVSFPDTELPSMDSVVALDSGSFVWKVVDAVPKGVTVVLSSLLTAGWLLAVATSVDAKDVVCVDCGLSVDISALTCRPVRSSRAASSSGDPRLLSMPYH